MLQTLALCLAFAGPMQEGQAPPDSVKSKGGSPIKFYGFLRLDMARDDSRFNDNQLPVRVLPEPPDDLEEFTMHGRLTRFGLDLDGGTIEALEAKLVGKLEVDFYGFLNSDSRNDLRMRHAYLQLKWTRFSLLAGQTSDLISPRFPNVNADMVMWNAGNTGDRRPQIRGEFALPIGEGGARLDLQFMIGQTGAVDAKDGLTATAVLSGENSGVPTFQARVNVAIPFQEKKNLEIAAWFHTAQEKSETAFGGETDFTSSLVGLDLYIPVYEDKVWIHGEVWKGENLSDVRGGIGQGINATTGSEIESKGGWIEIGLKVSDVYTVTVGFSTDDPKNDDLGSAAIGTPGGASGAYSTSGAKMNKVFFTSHTLNFKPVTIGFEVLKWETDYVGIIGDGDALRIKAYIAYNF
jgi:hypothetical protein